MKAAVCVLAALTVTFTNAQVVRLVKDLSGESVSAVAIDGTGMNVFAVASSNQYGTDPKYRNQLFRWDAASGVGTQLTNFQLGVSAISVSDDGQWLAFISTTDLTGNNKDESSELFVMHPDGTGLAQVTSDTSLTGWGVLSATISGSGNRIVFVADTDPLGTNPGRTVHVFVVDRDGTNFVQLAEGSSQAISDDGNRVVLEQYVSGTSTTHILTSPADGSSAPVVIATVSSYGSSVSLSGNGGTIAYWDYATNTISKINWDGTGLISPLATGNSPSITDDGSTVFYKENTSTAIHRIGSDGSGDTVVSTPTAPLRYGAPLVSGDGSRIALTSSGGQISGGSNPDGGVELLAMDASGGTQRQLTLMSTVPMYAAAPYRGPGVGVTGPRILTNGTRIYFTSNGDPLGANPAHGQQVFTVLPNGTGLAQVTQLIPNAAGNGVESLSVSDAGIVVFEARTACSLTDIFKINTNGTGLTQLTNVCTGGGLGLQRDPIVRFDGQWIVFEGIYNNVYGIYKISINGGAVSSVAETDSGDYLSYRMSTLPISYVVFEDPGNLDGLNPNHKHQISRATIAGGGKIRVALDPAYDSYNPDISGDGSKIVWESEADFVGENADHSSEIFLYDATSATTRQLTHTGAGSTGAAYPSVTRDGAWVYYAIAVDWLRVAVATGEVQRFTGFRSGSPQSSPFYADVDGTGTKTVFTGANIIHESPNWTSIFLADQTAKPAFTVGKASPTYLTWDPDPQSVRYDVIRGDLANLSIVGSTMSLGAVACVEEDSHDNRTLGNEDTAQPAPGQGLYFLYRGTTGLPAVTGSWGQGTGGLERVAGVGGCNP